MHRLNGEDAGFLYMESRAQPMNSMAVGILASRWGVDGAPSPVTIEEVRAHIESRLDHLPSWRWRIRRVPLRLHHPVCVRDPQFDLDFHLRTETLPAPGTERELEELFARIAERRLDRRHPLWQVTLVDGFADGRQALIVKYHHCLADGVAAFTTFSTVYTDQAPPMPAERWTPEPLPGRLRLIGGALADHARGAGRLPRLISRTRKGASEAKARRASAPVAVPGFDGEAPGTMFNDAYTGGRAYCRVEVPLADAKAIKDAAGVTLNDVALALIGGGMRRHLEARDSLPSKPLLASVPVSSEPAGAPNRQAGNHFWSYTTSLATDEADPWKRLATISAVSKEARTQLDLLGADVVPQWLDLVPPLVAEPGARALVARLQADRTKADANVLISNIRGPVERWNVFGTLVEDLYVQGPPSNGVGSNVMLWSYADRLLLSILSFADAMPDPQGFAADVRAEFDELSDLAVRRFEPSA